MLDFLIKNATVFDGKNIEPQKLTVGVKDEKIVFVGEELTESSAKEVIDAKGLYLCPGFIDTHASTGLGYTFTNAADNKLFQGVTTEIIGNCGTSSGPIGDLLKPTMHKLSGEIGFDFNWESLGDWFGRVEDFGLPFNFATYVGHSTLRGGVCTDIQEITDLEIDEMCAMLDQSLKEGALGMSTGLVYAPGSFATTEEIIELAKVCAKNNSIYVSHMRDERQNLEESIEETIRIGREAKLPILVSHLKAAEKPNWGKIPNVIKSIEEAREEGLTINFEVYPYTAVSTKLRTFIPKATLSGGVQNMVAKLKTDEWRQKSTEWLEFRKTDYANMFLITESMPNSTGKSILEMSKILDKTPSESVVEILLADPDAWIVYDCISEKDMEMAILWDDAIICSDSWSHPVNAPNQIGNPHPRTYGAFTRFLEKYVLQDEKLSFGEAVRKITYLPATWTKINNRGQIKEGFYADLALLNPNEIHEVATYADPRRFSEGTEMVWVNGKIMLRNSEVTKNMSGKIIKKGQL
ncbi:MAG: D-aminoacylase [Calditrichaeota bacterium]|nr:MAG: D-aminoacylase [Calditrichota bacterium]